MKQALIGVVQPDGAILASRATCGGDLAATLTRHYATATRATMLVSLGALGAVGPTPSACSVPVDPPEPSMLSQADLDHLATDGITRFHVFDRGRWTSWTDEPIGGELAYEAE